MWTYICLYIDVMITKIEVEDKNSKTPNNKTSPRFLGA